MRSRAIAVTLGLLVTASSVLAAPASVYAAWSRAVHFPEETQDAAVRWDSAMGGGSCPSSFVKEPGASPLAQHAWVIGNSTGPPVGFIPTSVGDYGCFVSGGGGGYIGATATGGVWPYNQNGTPGSGLDGSRDVRVTLIGTDWASSPRCQITWETREYGQTGPVLSSSLLVDTSARYQTFDVDTVLTVPTGARLYGLIFSPGCGMDTVLVEDLEDAVGGNCAGVGSLHWGVAGLSSSSHSGWGDWWSAAHVGCVFDESGLIEYEPPEGLEQGQLYHVGIDWRASSGANGRVAAYWDTPTGARALGSWFTSSPTHTGTVYASDEPPPGATGIILDIVAGTVLRRVEVGTGTQPSGDPEEELPDLPPAPTLDPPPTPPDAAAYLGSCEAPDGVEPWEWLAYIACLAWQGLQLAVAMAVWAGAQALWFAAAIVAYVPWFIQWAITLAMGMVQTLIKLGPLGILGVGLQVLGELVGLPAAVYDAFADVFGLPSTADLFNGIVTAVQELVPILEGLELNPFVIAQAIGDAILGALAGLGDAIATAMGSLLDALFVPGAAVADAWDALIDMVNGKAPIGWIVQLVNYFGSVLSPSSIAGPALTTFSFVILDAPISYNPGPLVGILDDYRPVLAAVIYVGCAWVIFRRIGGALGGGGESV